MAKAHDDAYQYHRDGLHGSETNIEDGISLAQALLDDFHGYKGSTNVPWELQVTAIFVLTGIDFRSQKEQEWMD